MNLDKNRIRNSIYIFCICLIVHAFEVFVIRTDKSVFAEYFVNKVFGIIVLFVVLHMWGNSLRCHLAGIGSCILR